MNLARVALPRELVGESCSEAHRACVFIAWDDDPPSMALHFCWNRAAALVYGARYFEVHVAYRYRDLAVIWIDTRSGSSDIDFDRARAAAAGRLLAAVR